MKKILNWILELIFAILFGVFILAIFPVVMLERLINGQPDGWGRYRG